MICRPCNASFSRNKNKKTNLTSYKFVPSYFAHCETCNFFLNKVQIIHIISEMESWKCLLLVVFSDLKNNKNSRCYRCSNKAKNRVFCSFRLRLLKNLTCWSNYDPGFGFYAKNYFGNDLQQFHNKTIQTCVILDIVT